MESKYNILVIFKVWNLAILYHLRKVSNFKSLCLLRSGFLILIGIIGDPTVISAQQPQVYNQFFMNPYIYNPAYAGVEGHATFFLTYRDQWANIESAPTLSDFSFHVPLKGGIALGASAFNITQGLLGTSAAKITGSYLVNIDRTHFLRFGMSFGMGINSVNLNELADAAGDPAIAGFLDQSSFLLGDFGMTYHFGHFNVGFALSNLFSYNPITRTELSSPGFSPADNIIFKMNYRGHISDDFAFEPHLIYRYSSVIPHQYEAVLIAHLYHIVWVGGSYRQDSGIIGLVGAKIKEKIGLGFSYELGNPSISSQLGPTLEVTLGYHLGTKKEHAEHVSSFIKSHRLSAEERAKKAELERERQLAALRASRAQQENEKLPDTVVPNSPTGSETDVDSGTSLKRPESAVNVPTERADGWSHQENYASVTRTNQFGELETVRRLEKQVASGEKSVVLSWIPLSEAEDLNVADKGHLERQLPDGIREVGVKYEKITQEGEAENIIIWDRAISESQAKLIISNPDMTEEQYNQIEKGNPQLTEDFRTHEELANSNDVVSTIRGTHLLELPVGNFVVGGAFVLFDNAVDYSDKLFRDGYRDAFVGYSSARGYYYVVVYQSQNISRVKSRRDQFRKTAKLPNAWVLEVRE
ncbi:MAG: PorP/SprF family type IX secretion system membrane protein [Ekhidna sp.]|nr:PorP/SprF family type IX secretion system membrane protein [Ekhidna sp.]